MVESRIETHETRSADESAGNGADPRAGGGVVEVHLHRPGNGWQRLRLTQDQVEILPVDRHS